MSDGGFRNWNMGNFGKAVGFGAVSGLVTAGIGQIFGAVGGAGGMLGTKGLLNEGLRAVAHGLVQGGLSVAQGGTFLSGFASGSLGSLAGSGFHGIDAKFADSFLGTVGFSALGGGVGAALTGGNVWQGLATGAIVGALNHWGHRHIEKAKGNHLKRMAMKKEIRNFLKSITSNFKSEGINLYGTAGDKFLMEMSMAAGDFVSNYKDMRQANFQLSDKYFHAKANFQATHKGTGGKFFAEHFSNVREIWDQRIKGDLPHDSKLDQQANLFGRQQTNLFRPNDYQNALKTLRPPLLPAQY